MFFVEKVNFLDTFFQPFILYGFCLYFNFLAYALPIGL